jgi:hypothetical protein
MTRRLAVCVCVASVTASALEAQTARDGRAHYPDAVRRAVESITEADVARRVRLLADDSMRGRFTPSPELEKAAQYTADEFRRFGLRPAGDGGTFFQRYPAIRRTQLDTARSFAMVMGGGAHGHWVVGRDVALRSGRLPVQPISGPVVLAGGIPGDTLRPFAGVAVQGAIILHVVAASQASPQALAPLSRRALQAGARAWILVTDRPADQFAVMTRNLMQAQAMLGPDSDDPRAGARPVLELRDSAALAVLRAAGAEPGALRSDPWAPRLLPGFTASISVQRTVLSQETAPNVIGVLEGSDPRLRGEYVFFTAHMDHVGTAATNPGGCRASGADSICNGADDDASGTAGVIELAEAFSQLNPRPRRSLVFMAVSGEERGLWGSRHYSDHPTLPLEHTVADLNLDMIGRNWRDTISAIGKEHSTLGEVADRVAADHPELNMRLVGDLWPSENFYFRSDHYHFARKGVPILFFFNGTHADYHRVSDHPDRIDAEKEARVVRMVFYIGLTVANAETRPQWNPESRRRIVEGAAN